jgi:hypothetical protein
MLNEDRQRIRYVRGVGITEGSGKIRNGTGKYQENEDMCGRTRKGMRKD